MIFQELSYYIFILLLIEWTSTVDHYPSIFQQFKTILKETWLQFIQLG